MIHVLWLVSLYVCVCVNIIESVITSVDFFSNIIYALFLHNFMADS